MTPAEMTKRRLAVIFVPPLVLLVFALVLRSIDCPATFVVVTATANTVALRLDRGGLDELEGRVKEIQINRGPKIRTTGSEGLSFILSVPISVPIRISHESKLNREFEVSSSGLVSNDDAPLNLSIVSSDKNYTIESPGYEGLIPSKILTGQIRAHEVRFVLADSEFVFHKHFNVMALSFSDVSDPTEFVPRSFSTLKYGALRFEDIYGIKERPLREGDPLCIGPIDEGKIVLLRMSDEGIQTAFAGIVHGLKIGWRDPSEPCGSIEGLTGLLSRFLARFVPGSSANADLDLMPTLFDWYASDPAVIAVATFIVAVATVVVGALALRDAGKRRRTRRHRR